MKPNIVRVPTSFVVRFTTRGWSTLVIMTFLLMWRGSVVTSDDLPAERIPVAHAKGANGADDRATTDGRRK